MQETWVRFLGWEDPLEKEMAIHSSVLAWEIPWIEEPCRLRSMGSQRVGHNWVTKPPPPCFWLWCWKRFLKVPWTVRISNQSIIKEIIPEYLLKRLMLKLKLQYFGHLMQITDSFEKTMMLGKIEGERRGRHRMRWWNRLDGHEFEQAPGVADGQGSLACCSPWGCKESDMIEWLNWTELIKHEQDQRNSGTIDREIRRSVGYNVFLGQSLLLERSWRFIWDHVWIGFRSHINNLEFIAWIIECSVAFF